jgi:hypothetical protein
VCELAKERTGNRHLSEGVVYHWNSAHHALERGTLFLKRQRVETVKGSHQTGNRGPVIQHRRGRDGHGGFQFVHGSGNRVHLRLEFHFRDAIGVILFDPLVTPRCQLRQFILTVGPHIGNGCLLEPLEDRRQIFRVGHVFFHRLDDGRVHNLAPKGRRTATLAAPMAAGANVTVMLAPAGVAMAVILQAALAVEQPYPQVPGDAGFLRPRSPLRQ